MEQSATLIAVSLCLVTSVLSVGGCGLMAGFLFAERTKRRQALEKLDTERSNLLALTKKVNESHNNLIQAVEQHGAQISQIKSAAQMQSMLKGGKPHR